MKKLISLALFLVLTLSLVAPAFADMGYVPLDTTPEWLEWKAAWTEANPDAWAAFDPDLWFEEHYEYYASQEEYMKAAELSTQEEFEANMAQAWLQNLHYYENQIEQTAKYATLYADEYAAFDPDVWAETSWYNDRAGYKTMWQVDDATFEAHMWSEYALRWLNQEVEAREMADFIAAHPEQYAKFDPDQWLVTGWAYYYEDSYTTRQEYMADMGATDEEFVQAMTRDWMTNLSATLEDRAKGAAYEAANPEDAAAFDPDAYFAERWHGDDKAEYMAAWLLESDQDFYYDMLAAYASDLEETQGYRDQWAALCAAEPERTAVFLTDIDGWLANSYHKVLSVAEYMELYPWYICQEEVYLELYEDWNRGYQQEQERLQARADFITQHGGVPGQLNVMVNGSYLTFPRGQEPYAADGVTYVPAATLNGVLGTTGGTGFLPLRETAQALGYQVQWDDLFQSVVVASPQALADEIDQNFTVVNSLFVRYQDGKTYSSTADMQVEMTRFNSLDGDEEYLFSGTLKGMSNTAVGSQSAATLDLSDLTKLPEYSAVREAMTQEVGKATAVLIEGLLGKLELEYRYDLEGGTIYLYCPLINLISEELAEDDWISVELPATDLTNLTLGTLFSASLGSYTGGADYSYYYDDTRCPVKAWDSIIESAADMEAWIGDGMFTESTKGWSYTLDAAKMAQLIGEAIPDDPYYGPDISKLFKELDFTLFIGKNGDMTCDFALRPALRELLMGMGGYSYLYSSIASLLDFRLEGHASVKGEKSQTTFQFHLKNNSVYTLTMTATARASNATVETAPPEGAKVIPMEDVF